MQTFTDSILQMIQNHAEWAWLVVFLIAFIESLAIVGLLMPGWILLVGIGTMVGSDRLEFLPVVMAAYFGAVLGEYLSYYAGYHYHEIILRWKWVAKHETLIKKTKYFFEKHGAAGVFFGRFLGPVRAVIPLVAGISEMPKRTFFWVNLTSGVIWAPLYLIPGILIGAAASLEQGISSSLLVILLMIGLTAWLTFSQTRNFIQIIKGKRQESRQFALLNTLLAWLLLLALVIILLQSVYYHFIQAVFAVLWSKLF